MDGWMDGVDGRGFACRSNEVTMVGDIWGVATPTYGLVRSSFILHSLPKMLRYLNRFDVGKVPGSRVK